MLTHTVFYNRLDLKYAKSFLPALAALLYSGHIRHRRDTIDLPLPYPAAWAHTVAYVYTGRGALLTDAVRENILYLGGKV